MTNNVDFHYGIIGWIRNRIKGRKVKFIGFREGILTAIFEDWRNNDKYINFKTYIMGIKNEKA